MQPSDWEQIALSINKSPERVIALTQQFILPEILIHPKKISNNSFDYGSSFKHTTGFTGIPWNRFAWPAHLQTLMDEEGTQVLVDALLKQKIKELDHPIRVCTLTYQKTDDAVEDALSVIKQIMSPFKDEKDFCALIDTGALLKGFEQKHLAKAFLKYLKANRKDIEGIGIYIDNEAMVFTHDGTMVPLSKCKLSKDKIFTFFDNSHITGADIPQSLIGKAVGTLTQNLFHKDLSQGVYRMRELANQQNVYYVATEDCLAQIRKTNRSGGRS